MLSALIAQVALIGGFAHGQVSFQPLTYLNPAEQWATAFDVNNDGHVVGSALLGGVRRPVIWSSASSFEVLTPPPIGDFDNAAHTWSPDGSVVLGWSGPVGWKWTRDTGAVRVDGPPGSAFCAASAITADNQIIAGAAVFDSTLRAAIWDTSGTPTALPSSGGFTPDWAGGVTPDGSVVIGRGKLNGVDRAMIWRRGTPGALPEPLPGATARSVAHRVSPDGQTVIGYSASPNGFEAYRWTETDGMVFLGDLPGGFFHSSASDMTPDASMIIGSANLPAAEPYPGIATDDGEAFLWTAEDGIRSIRSILEGYGLADAITGWRIHGANTISPDGRYIAGWGRNPVGETQGWIVTIPAPPVGAFLLAGALFVHRRRRA